MGDEDNGFAFGAQAVKNAVQLIRLFRCQYAGRFIKDQNIRLPVKRLQNLDALLHADTDIFDHSVGVDVQFVFFGKPLQFFAGLSQRRA